MYPPNPSYPSAYDDDQPSAPDLYELDQKELSMMRPFPDPDDIRVPRALQASGGRLDAALLKRYAPDRALPASLRG